ncbi:MAG: voltage-gated chloride channel family protein [Desulfuromonadaceae bacterium]
MHLAWYVIRWFLIVLPVAACIGSSVAFFLWLLHKATQTRWDQPWLIYLLPLSGIAIVWCYQRFGGKADGGNNLVIEQIHEPGGGVPKRMLPMVLLATVVTHLFGGSAGREGTAVQMGGSIAQVFSGSFKLDRKDTQILLTCGVAAGFGAVFGTPLTGAIFALEVLALGTMRYNALIPCLLASVIGDLTCTLWGTHHSQFLITDSAKLLEHSLQAMNYSLTAKIALASIAFGLAGFLFAELNHTLSGLFKRYVSRYWLRPVLGAALVLGISWCLGTRDYLGIGVTTADGTGICIANAFVEGGVTPWSWFWKLLLTAITLSCGFKGGEVTPLFFIGATLGASLATVLGVPVDLMAGLGFVAVFAGATNTPLACTIMGVELFGSQYLVYFALACFLAYFFSGHSGIYLSQQIGVAKGDDLDPDPQLSLRMVRNANIHTAKN